MLRLPVSESRSGVVHPHRGTYHLESFYSSTIKTCCNPSFVQSSPKETYVLLSYSTFCPRRPNPLSQSFASSPSLSPSASASGLYIGDVGEYDPSAAAGEPASLGEYCGLVCSCKGDDWIDLEHHVRRIPRPVRPGRPEIVPNQPLTVTHW